MVPPAHVAPGDTRRSVLTLRGTLAVLVTAHLLLALTAPAWIPELVRLWLLGNVVMVVALALLVRHARRHPAERAWTVPVSLALGSFALGGNAFLVSPTPDGTSPLIGQIAFLAIYPFLLAGILAALRQHVRHARLVVTLDGATGALAGAAVTTSLTASLMSELVRGSSDDLLSLAFVLCDIGLITASLGALAVVGFAQGRNFAVWAIGMLVFGGGDIVYADRLAEGSYRVGSWVDSLWLVGLALIAVGATMRAQDQARTLPPARTLTVVLLAPLTALAVLVLAPHWRTDPVPTVLALCALAGGCIRFTLAFLQVRELAQVREQALTDELTGVGNRRALYRRLDALLGAREEGGAATGGFPPFAMALIDLDHFKEVNDALGHAAGDELLQAVVGRFAAALDDLGTPYLLTRLGGDEFAVVLERVTRPDEAVAVGSTLRECLVEPVVLGRAALHVRASVGLSLAPEHGRSRSDLLAAADAAMYLAKSAVDPVCLYTPAEAGHRRNRLAVAEDLYAALERRELTVAYQPIHSPSGDLVAADALVRWDHPERGRMNPGDFLETAERYQLTQLIARRSSR